MGKYLPQISLFIILGVMVLPFNNCGEIDEELGSRGGSSCLTAGCVDDSIDFLALQINEPTPILIGSVSQFNVSGGCFVGEFPDNIITWRIFNSSGQEALNSATAGGLGYTARCINGEYVLPVAVPCPVVNGQASNEICTGINQNYTLVVTLFGIDLEETPYEGLGQHSQSRLLSPPGPSGS